MGAVRGKQIDEMTTETLLQSGADVNAAARYGYPFNGLSVLMLASESGQGNIGKLLLRCGANPHHRIKIAGSASFEDEGYFFRPDGTAFGVALAMRNLNVVRILWQAETSSLTTIDVDRTRCQNGEWDLICHNRAQHAWEDTKSESSGEWGQRLPRRGYTRHKVSDSTVV